MSLRKWFIGSVLVKVLDVATTLFLVVRDGPKVESNPFTANMMNAYGIVPGLVLNVIIISMLLYILYKYKCKELLTIATVLIALVVMINLVTILIGWV